MSYLTKYFAAFLLGCSRTTLVSAALTLGGFSWDVHATHYSTIHYGPNPSYDSIPITPKTWEEVDLNYFSVINGKRYQNTIDLLRPITWLHAHDLDKVGNTITLSLPEFGITHVKAYVVAIKPTTLDTRGMNWSKRDFRPVIGQFKRYALDVRTYTFRDSKGHIDHIHATPNHPFYVQNKHGFVAIEDVKDTDVLVDGNDGDDIVHLICDKDKHSHCGKIYSDGKHPMAVYNLEIYRQHVFRVGAQGVVVHNCNSNNSHEKTWLPLRQNEEDPDVAVIGCGHAEQGNCYHGPYVHSYDINSSAAPDYIGKYQDFSLDHSEKYDFILMEFTIFNNDDTNALLSMLKYGGMLFVRQDTSLPFQYKITNLPTTEYLFGNIGPKHEEDLFSIFDMKSRNIFLAKDVRANWFVYKRPRVSILV